ncbi:MAG: FAD-binding oxidoreductase [Dehalococcoidia bacterium]
MKPKPQVALPTARLVERWDITHDLWVIRLEPSIPFTFKPGQYCSIGKDGVERPYSICSAPHEGYLELFIELVPEGELTPSLYHLHAGDEVTLRPKAKGVFTMDVGFPNQVLVSTVTGVAPYISWLRDYLHRGASGHRFYLLQGASYEDEFTYDRELTEMAQSHPDFITYVPTVSRPQEERNRGWQGEQGRANLLAEKYVDRSGLDLNTTIVYACGHPGMIEDVKQRFVAKGFKVKEERFWKE